MRPPAATFQALTHNLLNPFAMDSNASNVLVTRWSLPARYFIGAMILATGTSWAQTTDLPDSADHPVLKRFTGSVITGYALEDWGQAKVPLSAKINEKTGKFENLHTRASSTSVPKAKGHWRCYATTSKL